MSELTLRVHHCANGHSYNAVFTGPQAQDHAVAFIERKSSTCAFFESEDAPLDERHSKVINKLYPTCHHGMDGNQCMDPIGPHHFGTYEQERGGW